MPRVREPGGSRGRCFKPGTICLGADSANRPPLTTKGLLPGLNVVDLR